MKRKRIVVIGLIILSTMILIFMNHNDFLYKNQIVKVIEIKTKEETTSSNSLGLEEKYYIRTISGKVTNGKDKGKIKVFTYEETYSSIVTEKYQVGDKLIIKNNEIDGLKRDFYIATLIALFIILMVIVGEISGLLSIVSVILNMMIFYIGLSLYFKGINILFLCIIESILFSCFSLFIAGGINKKTTSAITSVILSTTILLMMVLVITSTTNYSGINFNELSFLTVDPEDIIIPELLIGSLGAIMDVSITISSSISELIEKDKNISVKNLKKSSKQIGKDIMSTMSNVLFFTYLCSGLPVFVLALRNGFSIYNYITTNFSLELTRFLVGSIGIVMTIPIAMMVSIHIFRRNQYE